MSKTRQFSHPFVLGFSIVWWVDWLFREGIGQLNTFGGALTSKARQHRLPAFYGGGQSKKLPKKKNYLAHLPKKTKSQTNPFSTLFSLFNFFTPKPNLLPRPSPHSFSFSLLLLSFYTPPSTLPQSSYSTFHRTHIYISDPLISFPLLLFPKPSLALFLSVS